MPEESKHHQKVNKPKIYAIAVLFFILGNFVFETLLTFVENQQQTDLQPALPFTGLYLLVVTILLANCYIRRKENHPKQKPWWRILKGLILIVIAWLFFFGAWFAVSDAELERMRQNRPETPVLRVPEPYTFEGIE
jgi:drug/metabolite transporter (DMT)-like permease